MFKTQAAHAAPTHVSVSVGCAPQELQNDLADRCEELRAAQRKLVMARTSSNAAAMETAGPQPAPATPAKEIKRRAHIQTGFMQFLGSAQLSYTPPYGKDHPIDAI
jgi:hypothetical protein